MSLFPLLVCSILIDPFPMSYLWFLSPLLYLSPPYSTFVTYFSPFATYLFIFVTFLSPFVNNHQKGANFSES
jgi:hypothetical protein